MKGKDLKKLLSLLGTLAGAYVLYDSVERTYKRRKSEREALKKIKG